MNEEELMDRKSALKKQILTLEWDKKMSQLNFGKGQQLEGYKKDLEAVESELVKIHTVEN